MARALLENIGYNEQEIVVERPDGSRRIALAHANPFFDDFGRVAGAINILVDITDRKQSDEVFRQSEERLRNIFNQTTAGIAQVDLTGRFLLVNQRFCEITGYSAEQLRVKTCTEITHPLDQACNDELFVQALRERKPYVIEKRYVRPDGSHIWVRNSVSELAGEDGQLKHMLAVCMDITEQKQAELLQREQNRLLEWIASGRSLEDVLTALTEAVSRLHPKVRTCVLLANGDRTAMVDAYTAHLEPSFGAAIYGAPIGELAVGTCGTAIHQGKPVTCTDIAGSEVWSEAWRNLCFAHGIFACHSTPVFSPSGKTVASFFLCFAEARVPNAWELRLAEFGAHIASIVIECDRAGEALRRREEDFRTLADNIAQLAWMADGEGWIFWYNQRWFDYTGTTLEQMQGWGWQSVHHPDYVDRVVEKVSRHWKSGETWEDTFPLRGKDGGYRWFLSRALPIRDGTGKIVRWFGTNTDITEQRAAEEALKEADRKKDEFLATLAHELRNPLAPIRNGLQVMKLARNDDAAVEQSRTMMERQFEQLVRLVDDLLDVSRISQGKIELRKERIELTAVVIAALESCETIFKQHGHELTVKLPEQPVYVDADKTRLSQALCNLLNNAAKYTERGGHIWLTVEHKGGDALLGVKDSGVGIPAPMLAKVFDLFTQVDRSLEKSQGGLGIGLTIVKSLIEMHGGSIEAKSEGEGMGSDFVIRLPIARSSAVRPRTAPDSEPVGPVVRRRILVVDDNVDAAKSMAMMLQLMGNEVRTAHDGLAGVATAAAFRPDLILLDIGMPKLNGYEAARRIRQEPWGRETVLVALTGWGQEEDKRRSQEAGFKAHLVKPVDPRALEKLLAGVPIGMP